MAPERKLLKMLDCSCFKSYLEIFRYSAHAWYLLKGNPGNSFSRWPNLKVFAELLTILLKVAVDFQDIARQWHKPIQKGILWEDFHQIAQIMLDSRTCCRKKPEILASPVFRYSTVYILKGNVRNVHQMAQFGFRTVAPASRSHF